MDYEKQEKEFYEIMRRERRKVESSDISENKKSRLYLLFDKVIERFDDIIEEFKENKTNYFERKRAFECLNKILGEVCNPLKKPSLLEMISKKPNEKLREIVEKQLANKNILPFPNYIPPSNN